MSVVEDGSAIRHSGGRGTVRLTAAQAIVRFLKLQSSERDGISRPLIGGIFGIFGHGNVCGIGPALEEDERDPLRFFQPKSEQAMVHAAIGYAKAHDLLSTLACTASIGPGSTNLVTGAATATVNRVPVLLLPSDTFANRRQGPVMQALENPAAGDLTVNDALRPVSAFFDRITRPEQLLTALPQAMRILLDPAETGAVTLSLHQDVQAEAYDFPLELFDPRTWRVIRRPPAEGEIAAAVEAIRGAERPLIVAGGGVHYSGAREELAALSERCGIPVTETSAGKGALMRGELGLGGVGHTGTRAANALAREADVVICVGTRLIDLTTGSHTLFQDPGVRFVGVNARGADAIKLGAAPIVADAREALTALTEALAADGYAAPDAWGERGREQRVRWQRALEEDLQPRPGERTTQGQLLTALNRACRAGDHLVVASGTPHVDVHKIWDCTYGGRCYMEVGFSCMGHEIPAAIGVRLGDSDAGEVYATIGDGTYLMNPTELVTAAQEGLKITVVVFENHGYQSIHGLQRNRTGRSFGLEFRERDPAADRLIGDFVELDLVANAASLGCLALRADTVAEFERALDEVRAQPRPAVIVCRTEPLRLMLGSDCWWDVGVAEESEREETRRLSAENAAARRAQRFYH